MREEPGDDTKQKRPRIRETVNIMFAKAAVVANSYFLNSEYP